MSKRIFFAICISTKQINDHNSRSVKWQPFTTNLILLKKLDIRRFMAVDWLVLNAGHNLLDPSLFIRRYENNHISRCRLFDTDNANKSVDNE